MSLAQEYARIAFPLTVIRVRYAKKKRGISDMVEYLRTAGRKCCTIQLAADVDNLVNYIQLVSLA